MSVKALLKLNKRFSPASHPFNIESDGGKTYGEWEFERGHTAVGCFSPAFDEREMFFGKNVLDVGCGEGGKSLYFASCGAEYVTGIDIIPEYKPKAEALAKKLGLDGKFRFVVGDASALPFCDGSFDTVIMNDFFEHAENPAKALGEAMRVLKAGGRLFVNFPPYYHPWGAHLSDAINIPWVHMFFGEKTMIEAYKILVSGKPDGKMRLDLRIRKKPDGTEYLGYINKMTLKKASKTVNSLGLRPVMRKNIPLRPWLVPASHLPLLREMFVKTAIYVFEKERTSKTDETDESNGKAANELHGTDPVCAGNNIHNRSLSRINL